MLGVSSWPLSTIFLLNFGIVPTVWYFFAFILFIIIFQIHVERWTTEYMILIFGHVGEGKSLANKNLEYFFVK